MPPMWCETMTSGERMGALMRGERPDRVPVIPFLSGHAAVVCGQPITRISDDAEESFDGTPLYAYASAGGWEFGGDIEFPVKKYSGAIVVTRTPIQTEDDVYALKVADDVSKAGALPIALGIARKQAEYGMPVTLQIGAPLTWAGSVIGEERMMGWFIKKPDLVHAVLDKVSEFLIKVAEYYVKEFGADKLMAFHGAATETNKLISPKQFETFSLPYLQRINQAAIDMGDQHVLHPHLRRAEQEPQVLAAGAHDQADRAERRPRDRSDHRHGDVPRADSGGQRRPHHHPRGPRRRGAGCLAGLHRKGQVS
jgi:uroporphyrinogen decarboxylase